METISVRGEEYVKAIDIAKELGYTTDYVGQLCRAGKVRSKLVGRSWYVDPDSIKKHKRSRYRSNLVKAKRELKKTQTAQVVASKEATNDSSKESRVSISTSPKTFGFCKLPVSNYELDKSELYPVLDTKTTKAQNVTTDASVSEMTLEIKPVRIVTNTKALDNTSRVVTSQVSVAKAFDTSLKPKTGRAVFSARVNTATPSAIYASGAPINVTFEGKARKESGNHIFQRFINVFLLTVVPAVGLFALFFVSSFEEASASVQRSSFVVSDINTTVSVVSNIVSSWF